MQSIARIAFLRKSIERLVCIGLTVAAPAAAQQLPLSSQAIAASVDNWALDQLDGDKDGVFRFRATGAGVNLYMIDTGVLTSHTEFGGRAVAIGNFYQATSDRPTGRDISDCGGYGGHGTHNASYAVGARYGVAKGASLYVAKAAGGSSCDSDPVWVAHAVNYIAANYPRGVVTLSFAWQGHPNLPVVVSALLAAMDKGFIVVVGAGCAPSVDLTWLQMATEPRQRALIVAGTDETLTKSAVDYGRFLSLFAPGMHVLGAGNGGDAESSVQKPARDTSCSDSFSAPHVAGVAAAYLQLHPTATPQQVHDAIVGAALPRVRGSLGASPNRFLHTAY